MNSKEYTKRLAKEAVKTVDDLIAEGNPWKMLAFFNSDEMIAHKAPFVWALNPDDKNTKVYTSYLSAHQFTILDLNDKFKTVCLNCEGAVKVAKKLEIKRGDLTPDF